MKPSLDGVRARIARAKEHFEDLKLKLAEHDRADPAKIVFLQHEADERTVSAVVKDLPQVPMNIRLLIGEVVHMLAGALDNLVFQLSLSHQVAIGNANAFADCDRAKTYFPIFIANEAADQVQIQKRLKLMAPAPADLIRNMQPYNRPNPSRDPLWALYRLDVIDKHRVVLAVTHAIAPTHIFINAPSQDSETVIEVTSTPWRPLVEGSELFRATIPAGYPTDSPLHFNVNAARRILFNQTGLCDGDNVLWYLKSIIPHVETNVVDVLAAHVV